MIKKKVIIWIIWGPWDPFFPPLPSSSSTLSPPPLSPFQVFFFPLQFPVRVSSNRRKERHISYLETFKITKKSHFTMIFFIWIFVPKIDIIQTLFCNSKKTLFGNFKHCDNKFYFWQLRRNENVKHGNIASHYFFQVCVVVLEFLERVIMVKNVSSIRTTTLTWTSF